MEYMYTAIYVYVYIYIYMYVHAICMWMYISYMCRWIRKHLVPKAKLAVTPRPPTAWPRAAGGSALGPGQEAVARTYIYMYTYIYILI